MQPIKDRDIVHVILLEDGSYWVSGGFNKNRDGIMSTLNLSSATFLPFEDACYKANKLNENGKRCDVIPVLLMVEYPETCEYILELNDFNTWKCSKCGLLWHLAADTPIENEMYYCPKCGRKIIREVTQN